MPIRTVAAALNGSLVMGLYIAAWGVPSASIAVLELTLATGAMVATWYGLKKLKTPSWVSRARATSTQPPAHA